MGGGGVEVLGLDGEWCDRNLLFKYISPDKFRCVDLEQPITLDKTYDLVISLEVAEHLSEKSADTFVQSLVRAGKIILFSAAFPGQGGTHHLNEQWPSYWAEKFKQHGYKSYDIIRREIWNHQDVETWYKQNMFLVVHSSINIDSEEAMLLPIVHPDYLYNVIQCKMGIRFYLKLLLKSIVKKINHETIQQRN